MGADVAYVVSLANPLELESWPTTMGPYERLIAWLFVPSPLPTMDPTHKDSAPIPPQYLYDPFRNHGQLYKRAYAGDSDAITTLTSKKCRLCAAYVPRTTTCSNDHGFCFQCEANRSSFYDIDHRPTGVATCNKWWFENQGAWRELCARLKSHEVDNDRHCKILRWIMLRTVKMSRGGEGKSGMVLKPLATGGPLISDSFQMSGVFRTRMRIVCASGK